jgi:predicted site-specific integrase-resolvase
MDDLTRQIEFLRSTNTEYSTYNLVTDCASGINFERKGLSSILDSCLLRNIGEVVVAHKDRLARFGFDLIKLLIEKSGGKLTVVNQETDKSSEQELADDLLSIIHIFSCRQMGKRRYNKQRNIENDKN